jgi:hypothetical protein
MTTSGSQFDGHNNAVTYGSESLARFMARQLTAGEPKNHAPWVPDKCALCARWHIIRDLGNGEKEYFYQPLHPRKAKLA